MARIRTSTRHHRGWEARKMDPNEVAKDIMVAIRMREALNEEWDVREFTTNHVTIARVWELLKDEGMI